MKSFLEEIEKNGELKAKAYELNRRVDSTPADFFALAKEYGCALTEDELGAVAGGNYTSVTYRKHSGTPRELA